MQRGVGVCTSALRRCRWRSRPRRGGPLSISTVMPASPAGRRRPRRPSGSRAASGTIAGARPPAPGAREQGPGEQLVPAAEPPVRRLVLPRAAGDDRLDRGARLGQAERDALAGQRVDVAGGVADQQHPARTRRSSAGAAARPRGSARAGGRPSRSPSSGSSRAARRTAPAARSAPRRRPGRRRPGSRRPRARRPSAPRRTASTARIATCTRSPNRRRPGRPVQPEHPAHRRVQPVGGDEVAGRLAVDEHVAAAVLDLAHRALHDLTPASATASVSARCSVVRRTPRPSPWRNGASARAAAAEVADAGEPVARPGRRRAPPGRPPRRASAPRRRPCRPGRRAARGPRRRGRRERRTARSRARPGRRRRRRGHAPAQASTASRQGGQGGVLAPGSARSAGPR